MTDIKIVRHASRAFLLVLAISFLGACGGNGGGGGGGTGGGSGITPESIQQLGSGASLSRSERFTAYGSITSQAQGPSKSGIYQVTEPTTTLGSESVGK